RRPPPAGGSSTPGWRPPPTRSTPSSRSGNGSSLASGNRPGFRASKKPSVDDDAGLLEPAPDFPGQLVGVADLEVVGEVQLRLLVGLLVVQAVDLPALGAHDARAAVDLVR